MEHLEKEEIRFELLRQMLELARGSVNDVVKLSFLGEEDLGALEHLDLSALAEFKRSDKGGVEMKFTNRMEVLEKLIHLLDDSGQGQADAFFQALAEHKVEPPLPEQGEEGVP